MLVIVFIVSVKVSVQLRQQPGGAKTEIRLISGNLPRGVSIRLRPMSGVTGPTAPSRQQLILRVYKGGTDDEHHQPHSFLSTSLIIPTRLVHFHLRVLLLSRLGVQCRLSPAVRGPLCPTPESALRTFQPSPYLKSERAWSVMSECSTRLCSAHLPDLNSQHPPHRLSSPLPLRPRRSRHIRQLQVVV